MSIYVNGTKLSVQDEKRLKNSASVAQRIENKWDRRFQDVIGKFANDAPEQVSAGGTIEAPNFELMLIEHYFEITIAAFKLAEDERELEEKPPIKKRLQSAVEIVHLARTPRTLRDIMRAYDLWRKGLYKPKSVVKKAQDLKKKYLEAVQKVWKRYSLDFREGGETTQAEIRDKIKKAAKTTIPRAQTIVRTETTAYYNQARKSYYDAAKDVTHYLFLAVRDKATTPWCTSLTVNGKRGRSGLVYAKDDPLLKKETPPIHWNCRSELLPLNKFNPSHQKLINDSTIQRRNHTCAPLPPEWDK